MAPYPHRDPSGGGNSGVLALGLLWDSGPCCRASQSQTLPGVSRSTPRGHVPVLGLREALMLLLLLAQDPIARTGVSSQCLELSLAPVCGRTRCWLPVPGGAPGLAAGGRF